jgi:hypothetical protein
MKTFLEMQVEQTARTIKIHLDHYIKEVLAGYAEDIRKLRKALQPKKVQIAPNVILKPDDTLEVPDPRKQKFYCSFVAKLQFAATWVRFDIAFAVSRLALFCASAGSSHWAALYHLIEHLAAPPASRSRIDEARVAPICSRATPMRIGEIAVHGDQRLVHSGSCCTTRHQSCGSRRCRRPRLSPRQRPSTTPHLRPVLRSCISGPFWNDSASLRRRPHQCMRTTPRASSGATTSSVDVNEPSTLTSASTLLISDQERRDEADQGLDHVTAG